MFFNDSLVYASRRSSGKSKKSSKSGLRGGRASVVRNASVNSSNSSNETTVDTVAESQASSVVSKEEKLKVIDDFLNTAQTSLNIAAKVVQEGEKSSTPTVKNLSFVELQSRFNDIFNSTSNVCNGVGNAFNEVLKSLGFATVTSGVAALGGSLVMAGEIVNRDNDKVEKVMDISQKVGSAVSSVSSVASTVTIAVAVNNMTKAIDKLKECHSSISSFSKVVREFDVAIEKLEEQENYDEKTYADLNKYSSIGSKIISTCNQMKEKEATDIHNMIKTATVVSSVGTVAAVAGSALEVAATVKYAKSGDVLSDKARGVYTVSHAASSVTSLGSTVLNAVAQGKLKKLAQSAVDCEAIMK